MLVFFIGVQTGYISGKRWSFAFSSKDLAEQQSLRPDSVAITV